MDKLATIKDIAKTLKISTSTVSRALRGQPDVSVETKKAVLSLAKELDYQPNKAALSLLKKHTQTIGVLVPNLDYFFATAIKGIDEVAMEAGYTVMVCQSNESFDRELINTKRLLESQVDGFIISISSETKSFDHFKRLTDRHIPVVFFDRTSSDIISSKVLLDNEDGGHQATEHLIEQGCKRIAFLGGPKNLSISNKRKQGYENALTDHRIKKEKNLIVHCNFSREAAYFSIQKILKNKKRPDGIFAVSDRLAIGAMLAIKEAGLSMPDDIALVGFNNEPIVDLLNPGISSIDQPAFKMGKLSAQTFFDLLKNQDANISREIILKPKLIVRESSKRK
ncbi:MAG TPA: LacI family DNA-binding transcriptional regulator [Chitinophagaceae bacterium]|jgi:LacI family transcriptional regulator|nr:LacI family DNA-binding transcriptional regulator [Chitinophagaceae bacterium]